MCVGLGNTSLRPERVRNFSHLRALELTKTQNALAGAAMAEVRPGEPMEQLRVALPSGAAAGQQIAFTTPDGRAMAVTVPQAMSPGSSVRVQYPPVPQETTTSTQTQPAQAPAPGPVAAMPSQALAQVSMPAAQQQTIQNGVITRPVQLNGASGSEPLLPTMEVAMQQQDAAASKNIWVLYIIGWLACLCGCPGIICWGVGAAMFYCKEPSRRQHFPKERRAARWSLRTSCAWVALVCCIGVLAAIKGAADAAADGDDDWLARSEHHHGGHSDWPGHHHHGRHHGWSGWESWDADGDDDGESQSLAEFDEELVESTEEVEEQTAAARGGKEDRRTKKFLARQRAQAQAATRKSNSSQVPPPTTKEPSTQAPKSLFAKAAEVPGDWTDEHSPLATCRRCLVSGQDYCKSRNVCTPRATKTCAGPEDHVTGSVLFAHLGHSMICPGMEDSHETKWAKLGPLFSRRGADKPSLATAAPAALPVAAWGV